MDCPWPIDTVLDRYSPLFQAIVEYQSFMRETSIEGRVPFITTVEMEAFYSRLNQDRPRGSWIAQVMQFINQHVITQDFGQYHATLANGPHDLGSSWRKALREEMGDLVNWRTPQILVCANRSGQWGPVVRDHEVRINLEDRPNRDPENRVVVFIHSYKSYESHKHRSDYSEHKYALADIDPWDVRHCNRTATDGLPDPRCRLPRPSGLIEIALQDLGEKLESLRSEPWPQNGKYWFLPPGLWNYATNKMEWRKGAFAEETLNGRKGPLDYKGQVWSWDYTEGHWDVELPDGGYFRITQNGDSLD